MSAVPTWRELESAGSDAGAVLDACEFDLERAIAAAANKSDRSDLAADLKSVRKLRAQYFEGAA